MIRRALLLALALALAWPAHAAERLAAAGSVEVLFEPRDDTLGAITAVIDAAREQILVQMYVFTSKPLARALVRAAGRGVAVEVLADARSHQRPGKTALPLLLAAGIPVLLETEFTVAHNKVLIADPSGAHPAVVTGSYNFTWSAEHRNAENVLILRDNPSLARAYAENWQRHRRAAQPFASAGR